MEKIETALDQSMRRQEVLNPRLYKKGVIRIRFGVDKDGRLTHYQAIQTPEGMEMERILSETVLTEAAPFFPPMTDEMSKDPLFQRMTLIVHFN